MEAVGCAHGARSFGADRDHGGDEQNANHGIVDHIAEHGVTTDEFEYVVKHPERRDVSHSSGMPCCWGTTPEGRFLLCVYEKVDDIAVYPVTAYEPSEE